MSLDIGYASSVIQQYNIGARFGGAYKGHNALYQVYIAGIKRLENPTNYSNTPASPVKSTTPAGTNNPPPDIPENTTVEYSAVSGAGGITPKYSVTQVQTMKLPNLRDIAEQQDSYTPSTPEEEYETFLQAKIYQPVAMRFDSYIYNNEKFDFMTVQNDRNAAAAAFAKDIGFSNYAGATAQDGGMLLYNSVKDESGIFHRTTETTFASWEQLAQYGLKMYEQLNDGGYIIQHQFLGDIEIEGGKDVTAESLYQQSEAARQSAAAWIKVNGFDPGYGFTNTGKYQFESITTSGTTGNFYDTFISSKDMLDRFMPQYEAIFGTKLKEIAELEQYYSRDAIIERTGKAGYYDEEMLNKIVEYQMKRGREQIEGLKTCYDVDVSRSIEETFANYLGGSSLIEAGRALGIDTDEDWMKLKESLSSALLAGKGNVYIKDSSMDLEQYLDFEKRISQIKHTFDWAALYPTLAKEKLFEYIAKDVNSLIEDFGGKVDSSVMSWFEMQKDKYTKTINGDPDNPYISRPLTLEERNNSLKYSKMV